MKRIKYLISFIILVSVDSYSQSRWIQYYMDNWNAPVIDLDITYDNGFLLTGWKTPNYPTFSWLIKTDVNGEVLWQKLVGGINGSSVCIYNSSQNLIGDLFLCGCIISDGDPNPMIIKLNACGEKEWCSKISTVSIYDFFWDCVFTDDGGCAALVFGAYGSSYYRAGIMRFSGTGDLLWQQYYQSVDQSLFDATLSDLIIAPDGGFLMTGFCYYHDPDQPEIGWLHPYYLKTDSLGNFEWETVVHKETGDIGGEAFMSLVNPSHASYFSCISHYYHSDTLNTTRPALIKLDLQGNIVGVYDLVHGNYDLGKIMTFDFLNDSILTGSASWQNEEDEPQSRVIIFDTLGKVIDSVTIINDHALGYTKTTHDNKIIILIGDHTSGQFQPTLFKLTQNLEHDTFYTQPFVYDSLCPYQIASDTIVPDDCGVIVGIEEEIGGKGDKQKKGGLVLWPNPASGVLNVKCLGLSAGKDYSLSVVDIFGREMNKILVPQKESEIQLDVGNYTPGIYLVVLKNEFNIIGSSKLIISQ